MTDRRGVALLMVMVAAVVIGALTLIGIRSAGVRRRLASDARWQVEAALVAATALAHERVVLRSTIDTLADSAVITLPLFVRNDGWTWRGTLLRHGALLRLMVLAERPANDGTLFAAGRASLLLVKRAADTVEVLGHHPRF